MSAAILKNSLTVRENVPRRHFEEEKKKKGPPPSYFSKRQDAKHVLFFIWPKGILSKLCAPQTVAYMYM